MREKFAITFFYFTFFVLWRKQVSIVFGFFCEKITKCQSVLKTNYHMTSEDSENSRMNYFIGYFMVFLGPFLNLSDMIVMICC